MAKIFNRQGVSPETHEEREVRFRQFVCKSIRMPPNGPITPIIIGAAVRVHRTLGPGLFESAYRSCLAFELLKSGLRMERERALPLIDEGQPVGIGYRIDFLVEDRIVVELKSVVRFEPVHVTQVLSYLRLADRRIGLLFNFNVTNLTRYGLRRILNGTPDFEGADPLLPSLTP